MTDDEPQPLAMIPIWDEGPLDDPGEYCCEFIRAQLSIADGIAARCRENHTTNTRQCPDQIITYSAKLREYSFNALGPSPQYTVHYCPSCGHKFPESLRGKD